MVPYSSKTSSPPHLPLQSFLHSPTFTVFEEPPGSTDDFSRHGFSGSRGAGEEGLDAVASGTNSLCSPPVEDGFLVLKVVNEVVELSLHLVGKNQVAPSKPGNNMLCQSSKRETEFNASEGFWIHLPQPRASDKPRVRLCSFPAFFI